MKVIIFLAAVATAGCTLDASCPPGSAEVGSFAVSYSLVDAGDSCVVTRAADGGATDAGLTVAPSASQLSFCAAQTDAGTQLSLHLYGQGTRTVSLDGGSFALTASAFNLTGSNCLCALNLAETVSGQIGIADGGTFGPEGDGGFPAITSFSGTLDDLFSASQSGTDCTCNLPCGVHYAVSASK